MIKKEGNDKPNSEKSLVKWMKFSFQFIFSFFFGANGGGGKRNLFDILVMNLSRIFLYI